MKSKKKVNAVTTLQTLIKTFLVQKDVQTKTHAAIKIQSVWKMYKAKKQFKLKKQIAEKLQPLARGLLERKKLQEEKAAIHLQSLIRTILAKKEIQEKKTAVLNIQNAIRTCIAQKELHLRKKEKAALKIQSLWKMYKARKQLKREKKAAEAFKKPVPPPPKDEFETYNGIPEEEDFIILEEKKKEDLFNSFINFNQTETKYIFSPQEVEEKRFGLYLDILTKEFPELKKLIPNKTTSYEKLSPLLVHIRNNASKYPNVCTFLFTQMHIYTAIEQMVTSLAKQRFVITNSIVRNLKRQFKQMQTAQSNLSTFDNLYIKVRQLGAHSNFYFNPIQEGNLPFHLCDLVFENNHRVKVLRLPCPVTQGTFTVDIASEYRTFVKKIKEPIAYFSLQNDTNEKWSLHGSEIGRVEPFRTFEKTQSNFNLFSFPMDGDVFKVRNGFRENTIETFKKALLKHMLNNEHGFYFSQKLKNKETEFKQILNQVSTLFFENKTTFKNEKEKQVFLVLLYAFLVLHYTIKLKLKYFHITCKDGVDRAMVLNIVLMYLEALSLGKEKSHAFLRKLQAYTHLPAFTARNSEFHHSRFENLIDVLDFLENLDETQKIKLRNFKVGQNLEIVNETKPQMNLVNNVREFPHQGVSIKEVKILENIDQTWIKPCDATTRDEYIKALKLDPRSHNPFIQKTFTQLNMQDQNVGYQFDRDMKDCEFYINDKRYTIDEKQAFQERLKDLPEETQKNIYAYFTQTASHIATDELFKWYNNPSIEYMCIQNTNKDSTGNYIRPQFKLTLKEKEIQLHIRTEFYIIDTENAKPFARTVTFIDVDFNNKTYVADFKTQILET